MSNNATTLEDLDKGIFDLDIQIREVATLVPRMNDTKTCSCTCAEGDPPDKVCEQPK